MALLRLILAISWVCIGCSAPAPRISPAEGAVGDGLRMLITDPRLQESVGSSLVSMPRLVAASVGLPDDRGCRRLELPGADAAAARRLSDSWSRALREGRLPHVWLLEPLSGASELVAGATDRAWGLDPAEGALTACFRREVPDWVDRLQHPALWAEAESVAYGSWRRVGTRLIERRQPDARHSRHVRRVALLEPEADAAAGFDLGVLEGAEVERALAAGGPFEAERVPGWDTVFTLWLDAGARWTSDPMFRRWLALQVDRDSAARYLFGSGAEPARGLTRPGALPEPPEHLPFSSTSAPRLDLAHDLTDPRAVALAARLKAVLEGQGVAVRLVGRGATARPAATLLAHRPAVADPLLALLETLWEVRPAAAAECRRLQRATRIPDRVRRADRAAELESDWLADGRLVPLVRLHTLSIRHRNLTGVEFGPSGVVWLERAVWRR